MLTKESNLYNILQKCQNHNIAEKILFNYIKYNKYYDSKHKELIDIEIKKNDLDVYGNFYYVNDKYLVIDKKSKDYNTIHYNTIFLVYENYVKIFQKGNTNEAKEISKNIIDFFISKEYKRKLKIENLNESFN